MHEKALFGHFGRDFAVCHTKPYLVADSRGVQFVKQLWEVKHAALTLGVGGWA